MILPLSFYQDSDVVKIAKKLLGKYLLTKIGNNPVTGGMIIETEAYAGPEDKASHAYGNRRTKRTEVMFHKGGVAYVYLCYGIHSLFNVVTNQEGTPHAVLIRAIRPEIGIETMLKRRGKTKLDNTLTNGPGSLAKALGIGLKHNGVKLNSPPIWIEDRGVHVQKKQIEESPRIGIDFAKEHALLDWRFRLC